jgi:hypothetical protein
MSEAEMEEQARAKHSSIEHQELERSILMVPPISPMVALPRHTLVEAMALPGGGGATGGPPPMLPSSSAIVAMHDAHAHVPISSTVTSMASMGHINASISSSPGTVTWADRMVPSASSSMYPPSNGSGVAISDIESLRGNNSSNSGSAGSYLLASNLGRPASPARPSRLHLAFQTDHVLASPTGSVVGGPMNVLNSGKRRPSTTIATPTNNNNNSYNNMSIQQQLALASSPPLSSSSSMSGASSVSANPARRSLARIPSQPQTPSQRGGSGIGVANNNHNNASASASATVSPLTSPVGGNINNGAVAAATVDTPTTTRANSTNVNGMVSSRDALSSRSRSPDQPPRAATLIINEPLPPPPPPPIAPPPPQPQSQPATVPTYPGNTSPPSILITSSSPDPSSPNTPAPLPNASSAHSTIISPTNASVSAAATTTTNLAVPQRTLPSTSGVTGSSFIMNGTNPNGANLSSVSPPRTPPLRPGALPHNFSVASMSSITRPQHAAEASQVVATFRSEVAAATVRELSLKFSLQQLADASGFLAIGCMLLISRHFQESGSLVTMELDDWHMLCMCIHASPLLDAIMRLMSIVDVVRCDIVSRYAIGFLLEVILYITLPCIIVRFSQFGAHRGHFQPFTSANGESSSHLCPDYVIDRSVL